jgi:hypothetical protein
VERSGAEKLQPRARKVVVLHRDHDHGYVFPKAGFVVMEWSDDGRPCSKPFTVSKIHDPVFPSLAVAGKVLSGADALFHPSSADLRSDSKVSTVHVDDVVDVSMVLPSEVLLDSKDVADPDYEEERPSHDTSRAARKQHRRKQKAEAVSKEKIPEQPVRRSLRARQAVKRSSDVYYGDAAEAAHLVTALRSTATSTVAVVAHDGGHDIQEIDADDYTHMF